MRTTIIVSTITLVTGIVVGLLGSKLGERVTLVSLAPDDVNRVWLVELPSVIDRNFALRVENIKERRTVTVFRSPDEGKPIGSERIIWAVDSSRFVLLGRHFYVNPQAQLPGGERLYLMYDLQSGKLWCNATQQSTFPPFSREDLSILKWRGYFTKPTGEVTHRNVRPQDLSGTYSYTHSIQEFDGHQIKNIDVADTLRLETLPNGALKFDFNLVRSNGHTCELNGVADDRQGYFEYMEQIKLDDYTAKCVLRIRFTDSTIRLEDVNKECRLAYCGMRARIDGATFSR